jgi:ribonuclease HI
MYSKLCVHVGIYKLRIHTDSSHLIDSLERWLPKWLNNGWVTSSGERVANRRELEYYLDAERDMDVKFVNIALVYFSYFNLYSVTKIWSKIYG